MLMFTALQKWMERTKDDEDNRQDGPIGYDNENFVPPAYRMFSRKTILKIF